MDVIQVVFTIILPAISPIIFAVLAFLQNRKIKADERYRNERKKTESLREKERKREEEAQASRLKEIEESISKLNHEVKDLRSDIDIQKVERQLDQLHVMNSLNFEYVQSLSDVVITIGDAMASSTLIDDSVKKKLAREVGSHKNKENTVMQELIKIIV